jgi:phosphatidylglycerol---prolipoprotein diacylglyceryl transferase
MRFPVYIRIGAVRLHPHWVFETLAYAIAFRVYLALRRRDGDVLDDLSRWWIIAAAAVGATFGSKFLYWFEDPRLTLQYLHDPAYLFGGKTIVGALIGGLLAVEMMKKHLRITAPSGDLFAVPLCVGVAIGRVGCFLTGVSDHTVGIATTLRWGMDAGDGVMRQPVQLYEIAFVLALGAFLWRGMRESHVEGDIFKMFMVGYSGFRLACDFLKPDIRVFAGLSSIQWACVATLLYYAPNVKRWFTARATQESSAAVSSVPEAQGWRYKNEV